MSDRENFYAALIVLAVGICVHLLIPFQVSTDPIPGSRGFAIATPSTLPRLAAWGLAIVGLMWAARSFLRMRRAAGSASPVQSTLPADELAALESKRWKWSLLVWATAIVYVILIPAIGYAEASILFGLTLGLSMLWARPGGLARNVWPGLAIGVVAFPILLYLVFHRFFYVTLEPGLLSALVGG
jgi:hypothetical protein